MPAAVAATIDLTTPPIRRAATPVKLGFAVASIDALVPIVAELGGAVDDPTTAWEHAGIVHRDAVDPEGNVIELLEPAG